MATYRAVWNGAVVAESAETIVVDGYRYFPAESVDTSHLVPSDHHTVCGWKGEASYCDVSVRGLVNPNAAWFYPDPSPAARALAGHIGFWHGVGIECVTVPRADRGSEGSELDVAPPPAP